MKYWWWVVSDMFVPEARTAWHPIELMIEPLAFSKPGKAFLNKATHTIKRARATAEIISEEPEHDCEFEFCVARQGNNTVHDGFIASGADHTRAFSSIMGRYNLKRSFMTQGSPLLWYWYSYVDITVPRIISLVEDKKIKIIKHMWSNNQPFASEKETLEAGVRRCFDDKNISRVTISL